MTTQEQVFDRLTKNLLDEIQSVIATKESDRNIALQHSAVHTLRWADALLNIPEPHSQSVLQNRAAVKAQLKAMQAQRILDQSQLEKQVSPVAGGRRYTRRSCKKTPCRKMGFTQKASCRPYKNCYKPTRS